MWDLQCFQTFRNCCLFCTFCCFRNLNSAGYGKRCSNHHFRHCAQFVSEIYSVFKVFEIAVCFAHFGIFEIWTPLNLTMLTMVNVVQIIFSNIAHTVYTRFTLFSNFSKLRFVLHILAYSKFELRWISPCLLWWTLFKSSFPTLRTLCIWDLQCFQTFLKLLFVLHILVYSKFLLRLWATC